MNWKSYSDEELFDLAKSYAGQTFEKAIEKPDTDWQGLDQVCRHRQINATKIVGYMLQLKQATDEEAAPLLGMIIAEMKKSKTNVG